jgi:hypothetical protein
MRGMDFPFQIERWLIWFNAGGNASLHSLTKPYENYVGLNHRRVAYQGQL